MRKALRPFAFFAALTPLFLPRAGAETTISTSTTTPVSTSSTGDLTVTGSVIPTTGPTAVTIDSANTVTNSGTIGFSGVDSSTALLIDGGSGGALTNSGAITNSESYSATDSNSDGILDGVFAQGTDRYGIRVASPFVGSITQTSTGAVTVHGNNSSAIEIDGAMTGDVNLQGSITALGDDVYGLRTTAPITGKIFFMGTESSQGAGAQGVSIEGGVSGGVTLQSTIINTGYRFTTRPADTIIPLLTADEMQQAGSAVTISGDVGGGILFDIAPTLSSSNSDVDGDGILDVNERNSAITQYGSAPAVQIGGATSSTVGPVGTGDLDYGFINRGTIYAYGLLDDISAEAVRIENADLNGGGSTGGMLNSGTIAAYSYDAGSTGVSVGAGANLASLDNTGLLLSTLIINKTPSTTPTALGVLIESGADVASITNSGSITADVLGSKDISGVADAVAIRDQSTSALAIVNSGAIKAIHEPINTLYANLVTGQEIAIDHQTGDTTITQTAPAAGADAPLIQGDILLGAGADTIDLQAGSVIGDVSFGGGADTLSISGGAVLTGAVTESGYGLTIDVSDGQLNLLNSTALTAASAHFGSGSLLSVRLDPQAGTSSGLDLTGAATFDTGSQISVLLHSAVPGDVGDYTLVHAGGGISGDPPVTLTDVPILYSASVAQPTADDITVHLERRTASDPTLGLNRNQAAIYEPFFAAAQTDSGEMQTFLGISSAAGLKSALDQLMPNATGAELEYAQTRNESLSSQLFSRYLSGEAPDRQIYAWTQEIGYVKSRDQTSQGQGYDGHGFGFAAGIDGPMGDTGYKGFGVAVTDDEISVKNGFNSPFTVTSGELMAHAMQPFGKLLVGARVAGAYDHFSAKRVVDITPDLVDAPTLDRNTSASWSGAHASGSLHAAYAGKLGSLTVRPDIGVDAVYMWEGGYTEKNGGTGIDLTVDSRQGVRADASATVTFGLPMEAESFVVTPSITLGARQPIATQSFDTVAAFEGGSQFTLTSDNATTPALLAGFAVDAQGEIGSFRIEATTETRSNEFSAVGRLVARLTF